MAARRKTKAESRLSRPEKASATQAAKDITGTPQSFRLPAWLLSFFLIALVVIAYLPVWQAGFIWDDDTFLFNNPLIRQPDGLYLFWFSTQAPDFFPLTSTTLWLEWRLWGNNPLGYHIVNVLLHALSSVLIWRVLVRLKIPGAWLAAALFALHPVNVESVAWITERKNALAMPFFVASILCYLCFEDTSRWRWYGMAFLTFILALLSKTAVVPLPVVLLGLAWWRRSQIGKRDVWCTLPFFGVALLMGLITFWFQSQVIGAEMIRSDNIWARLAGAGWAIWFYLYKALIPVNLIFVYPKWQIDPTRILSYVPVLLVLTGAVVFWLYRKGWGRACLLAMGYFIVMLAPVLGFLDIYFMRYSLVADHWQYFAIIGPIGLVAAGITRISDRLKEKGVFPMKVVCVILLLTLGILTWRQTLTYRDVETLWETTIVKNPACWMAHDSLAHTLVEKGRFDEAMRHYQEVLRLYPDYAEAHYNIGLMYYRLGQFQPAITKYDEAIRLKRNYALAYNNRGSAYARLGQYPSAIADYSEAIRLRPNFLLAYNNRGAAYDKSGQYPLAIADYSEAIRIEPDAPLAYSNRGTTYLKLERYQPAIEDFSKVIRLNPDAVDAYNNRGIIYTKLGQHQMAVEDFNRALRLQPDNAGLYLNRGFVYLKQNNAGMVCPDAQKACELGNCTLWSAVKAKGYCR